MVAGTGAREGAPALRDYGGGGPELRIRPPGRERARAAALAARTLALLSLPVGLVLSFLTGSFMWVIVVEGWAVLAGVMSYFGQAHNAVFVGAAGVRRISRGCTVTAQWSDLRRIEVSIPGNRIVVFRLDSSSLEITKLTRGRSRAAKAMTKNMPEGFEMRLDRASADLLVAEIRRRRPELEGLESWATASRLAPDGAHPQGGGDLPTAP